MNVLSKESIDKLILKSSNDPKALNQIHSYLLSFSEYHAAIYQAETWAIVHNYDENVPRAIMNPDYIELDGVRTSKHNAVIWNVNMLNKLCEKVNIPLVYEGVVSKDKPHRRDLANAVLAYTEDIINQRV